MIKRFWLGASYIPAEPNVFSSERALASQNAGRLCAKDYVALLPRALPASVRSLGLEDEFIFQQDNASCHSAKHMKTWMAKKNIHLLDWPAQSFR